tara:strand:+ start:529 stop:684 length:156 start_codon:yes stop_codon:yes gene_type:complete
MNKYFKVLVMLFITLVFCAMSFFGTAKYSGAGYGVIAFMFGMSTWLEVNQG